MRRFILIIALLLLSCVSHLTTPAVAVFCADPPSPVSSCDSVPRRLHDPPAGSATAVSPHDGPPAGSLLAGLGDQKQGSGYGAFGVGGLTLLLLAGAVAWRFASVSRLNRRLQEEMTGHQHALLQLKQNEARLRTLIETIPDLVWLKDSEGVYLGCNPSFESFFGAKEAEIVGRTDYDFVSKELADFFREHDRKAVLAGRPSLNEEWLTFAATGYHGLFETIKTPMYDAEGNLLGVLGISRDISERTRAYELLRLSEEKFASAFKASPDAVNLNRLADGVYLEVNDGFVRMSGYQAEEVLGKSSLELDIWADPAERERLVQEIRAHGFVTNLEARFRRKDGSIFTGWMSGRIISVNEVECLLNITRDVTERKQYQEQLEQARRAADAANHAKSEFLANMSHEIRTPMNGIVGMLQLLGFGELSEEQRDYLNCAQACTANLLSLINDILDLSKVEAGKLELEYTDFSLRRSIQELVTTQIAQVHKKHLGLVTQLDDTIPDILYGDQLRLKQILLNLLSNAIKFTEQGSIQISAVMTECSATSLTLCLSVRDSGIGMAPEALERIFAPFEQADNSITRKYGGTGLGLSICRRLAELMGGRIWAESTPGQGSCFFLELPFMLRTKALQADPGFSATGTALPQATRSLRLLVAEDNRFNADTLKAMLTKLGHRAELVENGSQLLEAWRQGGFDAILMDIAMPVMGGVEAAGVIRGQERESGAHLPIIAVTAHALRGDRDTFLQNGFDGYLAKPVLLAQLSAELERLCGSGCA